MDTEKMKTNEDTTSARFPDLPTDKLERRSRDHQLYRYFWEDYDLLYRGGAALKFAAGQVVPSRTWSNSTDSYNFVSAFMTGEIGAHQQRRFLTRLDEEEDKKYRRRWEMLEPRCYVTLFINYLVGKVCEESARMTVAEDAALPDGFDEWTDSPNGNSQKSLNDMGMQLLQDLCVLGRAGWMVFDSDSDGSEEPKSKFPCVTNFKANEILDHQRDDDGCLEYVILRKEKTVREFPSEPYIVRTYTYLDREYWQTWDVIVGRQEQVTKRAGKTKAVTYDTPQAQATTTGFGEHNLGKVPFVLVELPTGMWLMDLLAQWQINLINCESQLQYNKLIHANTQLLYTSPKMADQVATKVFGVNKMVVLKGGSGKDGDDVGEKMEELKRSMEPLKFLADDMDRLKQEGFIIVSMLAMAVDKDSMSVLGRSGESKKEDRKDTEAMLVRYGSVLRGAVQQLVDLAILCASDGESDVSEIEVQGYDTYSERDLAEIWADITTVKELQLGSPTLISEASIAPALRMLGDDVTEDVKKRVTDELRAAKGGDPIVKPQQTSITDTTTVAETKPQAQETK